MLGTAPLTAAANDEGLLLLLLLRIIRIISSMVQFVIVVIITIVANCLYYKYDSSHVLLRRMDLSIVVKH